MASRQRVNAVVYVDGVREYVGPKALAEGFAKTVRAQMRARGEKVTGRVVVR